ncbi:MAG TPA: hypothetical protein VNG32_02110 [Candidatus Dormibacteraeota bacterium]|nr:hypothetical protein [Candidatus Dormibacteraeota bacterium]
MLLPNNPARAKQIAIATEQRSLVNKAAVFGIVTAAAAAGSLLAARRIESSPGAKATKALGAVLLAADVIGLGLAAIEVDGLDIDNERNLRRGKELEQDLLEHHSPWELDEIWGANPDYFGEGVLDHAKGWKILFNSRSPVIMMSASAVPDHEIGPAQSAA